MRAGASAAAHIQRNEFSTKLLYGQLRKHGTKPEDLLGYCRETAANRLQNIGGMTINDLLALGRGLDIPIDTLRAAIKYQ